MNSDQSSTIGTRNVDANNNFLLETDLGHSGITGILLPEIDFSSNPPGLALRGTAQWDIRVRPSLTRFVTEAVTTVLSGIVKMIALARIDSLEMPEIT